MAVRQKTMPNLNVPAYRGWCLGYVDDTVNAPNRTYSAKVAYEVESRNGNVRTSELPIGVWVPIFFQFSTGAYTNLGHVALAKNFGNRVEIHDSEVHAGARGVYNSIAELLAWFGKFTPKYLGWSYWCDGVQFAEDYTPAPTPVNSNRIEKKGYATVTVTALNIRSEPSTSASIVAQYVYGQGFNYDSYIVANGFVWMSYMSFSGVRRYVAEGPNDGKSDTVYVSGGPSNT